MKINRITQLYPCKSNTQGRTLLFFFDSLKQQKAILVVLWETKKSIGRKLTGFEKDRIGWKALDTHRQPQDTSHRHQGHTKKSWSDSADPALTPDGIHQSSPVPRGHTNGCTRWHSSIITCTQRPYELLYLVGISINSGCTFPVDQPVGTMSAMEFPLSFLWKYAHTQAHTQTLMHIQTRTCMH